MWSFSWARLSRCMEGRSDERRLTYVHKSALAASMPNCMSNTLQSVSAQQQTWTKWIPYRSIRPAIRRHLLHHLKLFTVPNDNSHYERAGVCRRPDYVPTAKCQDRRHRSLQLPTTELTVGTTRPSAQRTVHRRSPSAQTRPSAQLGGARRSPVGTLDP
jgi:hypothetical protein